LEVAVALAVVVASILLDYYLLVLSI
jgi:hypothetical protein